jgi:hypothetical protein
MTTHQPVNHGGVDVAAGAPSRVAYISLILGILAVPGSILTWDTLPGQGFVWGLPPALLAVGLGVHALRSGAPSRWAAVTGIVLGGAMVLMMLVWILVGGD